MMDMDKQRPNIVFVLTDDQGYGDLSCHGNPHLKMPNIDKFHSQSIRFTNFHVGPTCAPTRSGLYTGHYANSTGVWHTVGGRSLLRKDEVTIADALRERGYKTALFGKWHLGDNYPYRPQDRGFETSVIHGGGGISQVPDYWNNDYFDDHYYVNGVPEKFTGYCTDVFFGLAFDYIRENKDNPFMCFITTNAPHDPFNVENRYSEPYRKILPPTRDREKRSRFYGMITNIDENFGKLDALLSEEGIADDTILIFMTDNGSTVGGPAAHTAGLRGFKNSEYDGGHRVPFFIRYANGKLLSPRDIDTLTANVDFMPTLLDLCGIGAENYDRCRFHGRSLMPLLTQENPHWAERTVVTDSQRLVNPVKWRKSAVMTDRWRLVNGSELYDMERDLGQTNDVSADFPGVVSTLRADYEAWWEIVSKKFDEEIPISIGTEKETRLTGHDWRHPDNPKHTDPFVEEGYEYLMVRFEQVRQAQGGEGYHEILVEKPGRYRFELRRWPREEDRALNEGIEHSDEGWRPDAVMDEWKGNYTGGKAVPIHGAGIRIQGREVEKEIDGNLKYADFELELVSGPCHLRTWFKASDGWRKSAYYIYVSPV